MMQAMEPSDPHAAPLVVRSAPVRAGACCLVAVFAGTLAGGLSTTATLVSYPPLVALFLYGLRGLFVMVRCDRTTLTVRNQWRTVRAPWDAVDGIGLVPRGRQRRTVRAAGIVTLRDGRTIPLQATLVPVDAGAVPQGSDRGAPKVAAIRECWQRALHQGVPPDVPPEEDA